MEDCRGGLEERPRGYDEQGVHVLRLTLRRLAAVALVAAVTALIGGSSSVAPVGAAPGGIRFVNFELPSTPPAPVGTRCPGSSDCANNAVEPSIRADGDGAFYAAAENGLLEGTIAARSVDGGFHYASLASPNRLSQAEDAEFAPGGGDVDVAVAPVRNADGFYNVYVASLNLANVSVSTSADGGATWALNPTSAQISGDDREWIAADGASKVCISYHDFATFNVDVDCSDDAGATFAQHALPGAIDPAHAFLLQNNQIGNLAIDPASHVVYQIMAGIARPDEAVCGFEFTCKYHAVWMGVSTDGGRTFTDYPVYVGPSDQVGYNHQFPNVAVDAAGTVYALFSDDHDVFYSYSSDHGLTWSAPQTVNRPPVRTAIFPWAVAGDAGKLDVVYYGTSFDGGTRPVDTYPSSVEWHAYFAQSLDATSKHPHFAQARATPLVHTGAVCENGIGCTGNRDLFDDFGVAASPTTGLASIIYSDDQFDPNGPNSSGCDASTSNTSTCDHTAIATQTSGTGIFGTKK